MQQSTSSISIRLVFEMMEGGGNVTINSVEDGHGEKKKVEDTTITSKHKQASATRPNGLKVDAKRRYKSIQQLTFTDETINSFFSNYTTISLRSTNLNLITKLKLKYLNDSKQQRILVCTIYLTESNTS